MKLTCIMCPMSCEMEISKNGNDFLVTGNTCIRGERYAISELTAPTRMITALVKTADGVASVKTTDLVPKNKVFAVLDEISKLNLLHVSEGDVVIKDVLGLKNIDVIVTRCAISE